MESQDSVKQAIDQLGQALTDADRGNGLDDQRDRIQYAMRLLMGQEKTKCNFCKSTEVTYNQLAMDSYCSDCGEWQEDKDLALYKISISWNVDDVLSLDDSLSMDECISVLDSAKKYHDANHGINWDTLQCHIDDLVEAKKAPLLFGDVLKDLDDAMDQAGFNQTKQ